MSDDANVTVTAGSLVSPFGARMFPKVPNRANTLPLVTLM